MKKLIIPSIIAGALTSCYPDESLNVPQNDPEIEIVTELDQYIEQSFTEEYGICLLYTSPSPRDRQKSRMPSSA